MGAKGGLWVLGRMESQRLGRSLLYLHVFSPLTEKEKEEDQ